VEGELGGVLLYEGEHDRLVVAGVVQANAVTYLMCEGLKEVCSLVGVQSPGFRIINMNIPCLRVVCVGKGSTWTIKRVAVPMIIGNKLYRDVNLSCGFLKELEVCYATPKLESFPCSVHYL